ncbi:MAG: hypothetical protein D6732_29065 [Methanobacteriota archaeon]|nr:MAG: hypothetical protein D6732_29065 [Euryarchaeota archaeon]
MRCQVCGNETAGKNYCESCGSKLSKDYLSTLIGRPTSTSTTYLSKTKKKFSSSGKRSLKEEIFGVLLADHGILKGIIERKNWKFVIKIHLSILAIIILITYLYNSFDGGIRNSNIRVIWGFYFAHLVSSVVFAYGLKLSGYASYNFLDYLKLMLTVSLGAIPFILVYTSPILTFIYLPLFYLSRITPLLFLYFLLLRIKVFYDFSLWRPFDAATIGSVALIIEFIGVMLAIA